MGAHMLFLRIAIAIISAFLFAEYSFALDERDSSSSSATLEQFIEHQDVEALRQQGPAVMHQLALLYELSDTNRKTKIAQIFYGLGEKSEEARTALMKDMHTEDRDLRLAVQWALGRVSNDEIVVQELLGNMQKDPNPLFRDKAACALAHDQIHLTEQQKVKLFEGLIYALSDEKDDVRRIAALVLQIQTGQTKGYDPSAPFPLRWWAIRSWKNWLVEYKKQVAAP